MLFVPLIVGDVADVFRKVGFVVSLVFNSFTVGGTVFVVIVVVVVVVVVVVESV